MSDVIQNMLQSAIGDGARGTKFDSFINFSHPGLVKNKESVYLLVKTSQFPGKQHEVYDLRFKGRNIPIRGQVRYDNTWTCTFYLTEDHSLKRTFEDWIESLDQKHNMSAELSQAVRNAQEVGTGYMTDMMISQSDFHGSKETTMYNLYNVFPKSVSAVEADYSSVGEILEFTVEFSYSHYDSVTLDTELGSISSGFNLGENLASNLLDHVKSRVMGAFHSAKNQIMNSVADGINSAIDSTVGSALGKMDGALSGVTGAIGSVGDSISGGISSFFTVNLLENTLSPSQQISKT